MKSTILPLFTVALLFFTSLQTRAQCEHYPWATEGTGEERDEGHGVAVDPFGNVFFGGWFDSDSITIDGMSALNSSIGQNGNGDVFIARFKPDGTLSWVVSAGGADNSDWCWDIAAGADGSVFATGDFYSNTMYFGSGVSISKTGLSDAWVAKWDSTGSILWARAFGAGDSDEGNAVAVDNAGNCYITGAFGQTIVHGSSTIIENAGDDLYVAVYDPNGTPLWAVSTGGSAYEAGRDIVISDDGRIYVAGRSFGDMNFGGTSWTNAGLGDLFLLAYTAAGVEDWMFIAGGPDGDEARGVALHPDGSIVLVGSYWSSPMDFSGTSLTANGEWDFFISRFNSDGTLQWVRGEGGNDSDHLYGVSVSDGGIIYAGGSWGDDPSTIDGFTLTDRGVMTTAWNDGGTALDIQSFTGSFSQFDLITSTATGPSGKGYYAGEFTSATIDFGEGQVINTGPGGGFSSDVFVLAQRSPAGVTVNEPLLNDTLCEGEVFSLEVTGAGLNVQWYFNGAVLSGQTAETLELSAVSAADAGAYYAILGDGCDSASTDTATLVVMEFPDAPLLMVSATGDSIFAVHTGSSLLWYLDGVLLAGLDGDTIIPLDEGLYTAESVNVLGSNICISEESAPLQIDIASGLNQVELSFKVYPNPLSGEQLNITSNKVGPKVWTLSNAWGQNVASGVLSIQNGGGTIRLPGLENGIYFLQLENSSPVKLQVLN